MHSNSIANLKKGNTAPRCTYIRLNEQTCTQPALRHGTLCRFHDLAMENPLPDARLIPFVEDATTLQLALMQVIKALQRGQMTRPVAGTILYALQIAAQNLPHFCEEVGHPFADRAARRKKQEEEDDENTPSLAEYLIEQLQLTPPPHDSDVDDDDDGRHPPEPVVMRQAAALAHPPVVNTPANAAVPSSSELKSPNRPINSPTPGVVGDIKACVDRVALASRRSPRPRPCLMPLSPLPTNTSKIGASLIG